MSFNKPSFLKGGLAKGYKNLLGQLTSSTDFNEQRKTARLPVELTVSCWMQSEPKHEIVGIIKDVSAGGCLLLIPREVNVGEKVKFEIQLDSENKMTVSGSIVRVHNTGSNIMEYGVVFDEIEKTEFSKLENYCFKQMYNKVGLKDWPTGG